MKTLILVILGIIFMFFWVGIISMIEQDTIEYINQTINQTIYITNTTFINQTIEIPCNLTCPECNYSRTREIDLIKRIKFLEGQQNKWVINETDCMVHNKTEEGLRNCEDDLDRMEERWDDCEDEIDELEDELDDCEDELCDKWNSSWC